MSAADFAELVRLVHRLAQSSGPMSVMTATGLHTRAAGAAEPLWARITGFDEGSGQYSWQQQQFDPATSTFVAKPGGRSGVGGGASPAFEANGRDDVPIDIIVRLIRVSRSMAYIFEHGSSAPAEDALDCDDAGNVLSVVTDVTCNGDGTISVTKTDICVRQVADE